MSSSKNVFYRKKSLDNGDVSKHFLKKVQTSTSKTATELNKNLKQVKDSQSKLTQQLKSVPFETKISKLPKDIDENDELVALLMKDPAKMTGAELNYIKSFNDEEFKRFINFLKKKKKEVNWVGNGWGSGHYIDNYITIDRKEKIENEKLLSLKAFLSRGLNNEKAKTSQPKNEMQQTKNADVPMIFQEEDLGGDQNEAPIQEEKEEFDIFAEVDKLKNLLSIVKNEITMKQYEGQNELINKIFDDKASKMKADVEKMKNMKKVEKTELEILLERFENTIKIQEEDPQLLVIQKIQKYLENSNLNPVEFCKLIDKNSFQNSKLNLIECENTMLRLKIIDKDQAHIFFSILKSFYKETISIEKFVSIIEGNVKYDYLPAYELEEERVIEKIKEKEKNGKDLSVSSTPQRKTTDEEEFFRKEILERHSIKPVENIKFFNSVGFIIKCVRGYLVKKRIKDLRIKRFVATIRVQLKVKRWVMRLRLNRIFNANKIQTFFKKLSLKVLDSKKILKVSHTVFKSNDPLRNYSATLIQRIYRKYRDERKVNLREKAILSMTLIKTKICLTCKKMRVTYICKICVDNHYCDDCFTRFHSRGTKRNHEYMKIIDFLNSTQNKGIFKKRANIGDETEELRLLFQSYDFDILKYIEMWDYDKKGAILYKTLKEAFGFKFFPFDANICEMILNISCRFINKNSNQNNLDEAFIHYKDMCKLCFPMKKEI